MNLISVSNAEIARSICIDASYISRIRNGMRELPSEESFCDAAAGFFCKRIDRKYQKEILAGILCPGKSWPQDCDTAHALLRSWLLQDADDVSILVSGFISPDTKESYDSSDADTEDRHILNTKFYDGIKENRAAFMQFLVDCVDSSDPGSLMLCLEDDSFWGTDSEYRKQCMALMAKLVCNGTHIRAILSSSYDSNGFLVFFKQWATTVPTNAIELYYYPKLRDGVFKRSLNIADRMYALVSSYIGEDCSACLTARFDTPQAVESLVYEFSAYQSLCKPLTHESIPKNPRHKTIRLPDEPLPSQSFTASYIIS